MTPDPKGSEVRPCPFCGSTAHWELNKNGTRQNFIYCDDNDDCGIGFVGSEWNNAYCWKENDRLRAEVERKDRAIHRVRTLWCDSKREPETGAVHIKYLDQFEAALGPPEEKV